MQEEKEGDGRVATRAGFSLQDEANSNIKAAGACTVYDQHDIQRLREETG